MNTEFVTEVKGKGTLLHYDPYTHGVTQSMLAMFLSCEKKTRYYSQGWTSTAQSGKALVFGDIFHYYQELILKLIQNKIITTLEDVYVFLQRTYEDIYLKYAPRDEDTLFALKYNYILQRHYFKYYEKEVFHIHNIVEVENQFKIKMPSGIVLRGKMDGVLEHIEKQHLILLEHKTKSRLDTEVIQKTLSINLQCMIYIIAYYHQTGKIISEICYDVVRKPALRRKVSESLDSFVLRNTDELTARPEYYFKRFYTPVVLADLDIFYTQFDNLLRRFAQWAKQNPILDLKNTHNCNNMYGSCPYLDYCTSNEKDHAMLDINEKIFKELEP